MSVNGESRQEPCRVGLTGHWGGGGLRLDPEDGLEDFKQKTDRVRL